MLFLVVRCAKRSKFLCKYFISKRSRGTGTLHIQALEFDSTERSGCSFENLFFAIDFLPKMETNKAVARYILSQSMDTWPEATVTAKNRFLGYMKDTEPSWRKQRVPHETDAERINQLLKACGPFFDKISIRGHTPFLTSKGYLGMLEGIIV